MEKEPLVAIAPIETTISSTAIGEALDREVFGGFVELRSEDPAAAEDLARVELPELDNGPHFFYGLQWWFFGVLAVFGFFYLAYDEWRGRPGAGPGRGGEPKRPAKPRITLRDRLDRLTAPEDED